MIQWNVRRNFNRLIKLKLQKILIDNKLVDATEVKYDPHEENDERDTLYNVVLANLESYLEGGKSYLTGYDYTIADIAYFNHLTTLMQVLEESIDARKYPNIDKWMQRMDDIGQIRVQTLKFQEELKKLQSKYTKWLCVHNSLLF